MIHTLEETPARLWLEPGWILANVRYVTFTETFCKQFLIDRPLGGSVIDIVKITTIRAAQILRLASILCCPVKFSLGDLFSCRIVLTLSLKEKNIFMFLLYSLYSMCP